MEYSFSWDSELELLHLGERWEWVRLLAVADMFETEQNVTERNGPETGIKVINVKLIVSSGFYPGCIRSSLFTH